MRLLAQLCLWQLAVDELKMLKWLSSIAFLALKTSQILQLSVWMVLIAFLFIRARQWRSSGTFVILDICFTFSVAEPLSERVQDPQSHKWFTISGLPSRFLLQSITFLVAKSSSRSIPSYLPRTVEMTRSLPVASAASGASVKALGYRRVPSWRTEEVGFPLSLWGWIHFADHVTERFWYHKQVLSSIVHGEPVLELASESLLIDTRIQSL